MKLAESEKYNSEALDQIWAQIDGFQFPNSRKNQLVWLYLSTLLDHQAAIITLTKAGLVGSALALLRSQIEAAFRGLWVALVGTNAQIERIITKDEAPFPYFKKMADELDRTYNMDGAFAQIAKHWGAFSSLAHGGLSQLGPRFDEHGNIAPNYSDDVIEELLRFSASVSLLCIVPLFRYAQAPEKAEALEAWLLSQGEKFDDAV